MTDHPSPSDAELAARLASTAGAILLDIQRSGLLTGRPLGDAGDQTSQAFLNRALAELRPDDAVLSEEARDDPVRLGRRRVWIVDPLDGTREFSEGRQDWAVHVALTEDGRPTACAVALPAAGLTLCTDPPPPVAIAQGRLKILVSRTRPPPEAGRVAERLDAELVPMGSAGAKAMAVVRGEAHAYLHSGGQYEWDSCAPCGVAEAAGLHVSRLDGSRPLFNRANPYMPDLLVCRPELAETILSALRA